MARKVFFSFHYKPDSQRAAQVRSIGSIDGNISAADNDWEKVTRAGDKAIEKWIAGQLFGKSCAVVLIGSQTASRKWVRHEIVEAWNANKGVVGIHIHKLKNLAGEQATIGANPFDALTLNNCGKKLSSVVKSYNPPGATSKEAYAWINENLAAAIDEAVKIRTEH